MYNSNDMQEARRSLNRCRGLLASVLVPIAAVYVFGIILGLQWLMLTALVAGFIFSLLFWDMKLSPVLRYVRFLKELEHGLRRSMDCIVDQLETKEQMQDGVRVHALHVRLTENGDQRILYVNASKIDMLPAMDVRLKLTCCGRHVVAYEEL